MIVLELLPFIAGIVVGALVTRAYYKDDYQRGFIFGMRAMWVRSRRPLDVQASLVTMPNNGSERRQGRPEEARTSTDG